MGYFKNEALQSGDQFRSSLPTAFSTLPSLVHWMHWMECMSRGHCMPAGIIKSTPHCNLSSPLLWSFLLRSHEMSVFSRIGHYQTDAAAAAAAELPVLEEQANTAVQCQQCCGGCGFGLLRQFCCCGVHMTGHSPSFSFPLPAFLPYFLFCHPSKQLRRTFA